MMDTELKSHLINLYLKTRSFRLVGCAVKCVSSNWLTDLASFRGNVRN